MVYTIQRLNQLNIILQKQSTLIFKDSGRVSRLSRKTKVVSIEIMVRLGGKVRHGLLKKSVG